MQKRVRFFSVVFTLLLTSSALLAQATLKGSVKDENGEALIAASISVAGTTTGVITNLEGLYEMPLPAGTHTINVSYTGYEAIAQVVTIGTQDVVLDFIPKVSSFTFGIYGTGAIGQTNFGKIEGVIEETSGPQARTIVH